MFEWDRLYTQMTEKVDYKMLMAIPPVLSVLMILVVMFNGLQMGLDFKGGTWMDALTPKELTTQDLQEISQKLEQKGLKDVSTTSGWDVDTGLNKITISTTTVVENVSTISIQVEEYVGVLREYDTATFTYEGNLPIDFENKLSKILKDAVSVEKTGNQVVIQSLNLNEEKLYSALKFYLDAEPEFEVVEKNFNIKSVGPTLGETFRIQGIKAVFFAFILMGIVVFLAFQDPIPSLAVMLAAVCDVLLSIGGMSLFNIPLEPASLAALLMLIGYSVDSDVLLTARTLKEKRKDVDSRINDAMITGLTMTGTTLVVMMLVLLVSTTLTHITTLQNIASVLLIGLTADLFTTWFTNAGILKWYIESKKRGRR